MGNKSPNFRCEKCNVTYYIKKRDPALWVRFMPPRYCPGCGMRIERSEK